MTRPTPMTGPATGGATAKVVRLWDETATASPIELHRNAALERVRGFVRMAQDAATRADQHGRHDEAARHWQDAEALALVLSLAQRRSQ